MRTDSSAAPGALTAAILHLHRAPDGTILLYVVCTPPQPQHDSSHVPSDIEAVLEKMIHVAERAGARRMEV